MSFFVDRSGIWSGGGRVVLENLEMAARSSDGLIASGPRGSRVPIVPRNVPVGFPLHGPSRPFVWMPQNALPYAAMGTGGLLQMGLRAGSDATRLRAHAMIRMSESLPVLKRGLTSPVIHNVLDEGFERLAVPPGGPTAGFFLALGSAHPYRNLVRLAKAHAEYVELGGDRPLVIQTSKGVVREERALTALAAAHPLLEVRHGGATRSQALGLMAKSHAVVFPSLVEASPISLLEARACGRHTAVSSIAPHEALAGPETVRFDGHDRVSLIGALRELDGRLTPPLEPLVDPVERARSRTDWATAIVRFLLQLKAYAR